MSQKKLGLGSTRATRDYPVVFVRYHAVVAESCSRQRPHHRLMSLSVVVSSCHRRCLHFFGDFKVENLKIKIAHEEVQCAMRPRHFSTDFFFINSTRAVMDYAGFCIR
jgi:hypothetical protein